MTKIEALAAHLECTVEELEQSRHDEKTFAHGRREYLVCDDEEADDIVAERIEQDLWAFNASFILSFIGGDRSERTEKALQKMQEELCEDAQPIIRAMIGDRLPDFVRQAVSADGRGHFLSGYDGQEREAGAFYIYRIN